MKFTNEFFDAKVISPVLLMNFVDQANESNALNL